MNDTREEQLLNAGKAADAEKRTDVESLKKKYAASDEKVYTVVTTVQVDDETEDEFTFLFKKPKAASYKSFLNQASSAGEKLGLTFLDTNNQLLSMPDILTELKSKYGETIDAVEKRELKEAFGTDEAVALIDLLYNNVETLDSGIQDLQGSMKNGISVTEEMAEAINNTPEQKFQVLKGSKRLCEHIQE